MKHKIWCLPLTLALALPFFGGCSSSDSSPEGGNGGSTAQDDRRIAIGKADLVGKCIENDKNYCGGKSKGNCFCDAACVQFGDCCSDAADSCGIGAKQCTDNGQCAEGQYCKSPDGCATPGTCAPIPTDIFCTQVITEYCDCNGNTKMSNTGCVWDRYDHIGKCEQKFCGGIAGIQCGPNEICVDDPNDSCDPNNGGADCGGVCQPKIQCGGIAGIPCGPNETCVDDPSDSCDPNNGGADCGGICVPKPSCSPVMCELYCPNGFKKGPDGCPVCECAPANTCAGACGGKSADGSCYCDKQCEKYKDCCDDYKSECTDDRTPASGQCVKNSNDACTTDADCTAGGCGGELCFNPAQSSGISTCECAGPGAPVQGCGCVQGKCTWYN